MKYLITVLACLLFNYSFAQKTTYVSKLEINQSLQTDSTLYKTIKGINKSLKDRFNSQLNIFTEHVIIDKEGQIPIDSLYKYNINDFKQIIITFDEPGAIYGPYAASIGIIRLVRKNKE